MGVSLARALRILRATALGAIALGVICSCIGVGFAAIVIRRALDELPEPEAIASAQLPEDAVLMDRDGFELGALPTFGEHRRLLGAAEIPTLIQEAIVASEDERFWSHRGFDARGITRAAWANLVHGTHLQGGSTITQQLLKLTLLRGRPSYLRKVEELLLAARLESLLTKRELLALYANVIPLGVRSSGIAAAAHTYFGKPAHALTLAEIALLVGMIPAPSATSPFCAPAVARSRQHRVLHRMVANGVIPARTADEAIAAPVAFCTADALPDRAAMASAVDAVLAIAPIVPGAHATTVDRSLQVAAAHALRIGLERYARRHGEHRGPRFVLAPSCASWHEDLRTFRGVLREWGMGGPYVYDLRGLAPSDGCPPSPCRFGADVLRSPVPFGFASAIVTAVDMARATVDLGDFTGTIAVRSVAWTGRPLAAVAPVGAVLDVRLPAALPMPGRTVAVELIPRPVVEGAVVAMDPRTRDVLAIVGGVEPRRGALHRALHAPRPIGSTVKPFVFAAAMEHGVLTADADIHDVPIRYTDPWSGERWMPGNWYVGHLGAMPLRDAIARSVNLAAVEATLTVGSSAIVALLERMGVPGTIPIAPAVALGAFDLTPLELANAYAVFASGGRSTYPRFTRADTAAAEIPRAVLDAETVAAVQSLLREPIVHPHGTARRLARLGIGLRGKTGTTTGARDAWFVGYTDELLVAVWVGYDQPRALGRADREEGGGSLAAPIAADVFRAAMAVGIVRAMEEGTP